MSLDLLNTAFGAGVGIFVPGAPAEKYENGLCQRTVFPVF
jgi:hypothetical protein